MLGRPPGKCHIWVMSDEPDNIVLIYLRRLDTKMDRLAEEMHDVKIRLTTVEEGLAGCNRRLDRVDRRRLERIERRDNIAEAPGVVTPI